MYYLQPLLLEQKHNFSASLIQEAYRADRRIVGGRGDVVGSTNLFTLNNFVVPRSVTGLRSIDSRGGYAVTLHYDYEKLLLLDLQGRQDRVSNFWDDNKTGYFWSAGVGVDFARLDALKSSNLISQLKLSASYGKIGNLPNSNVIPFSRYRYDLNYDDKSAAYPYTVDNKDLRWEVVNPLNIGIDLGFWKDRLVLGVAYFNKLTRDMIFDIPLSLAQGQESKYINVGEMKNAGFEFTLGTKIIQNEGDGFNWVFNANISTLENKITKLYGGKEIVVSSTRVLREGEVANAFYLREWAGVDPANGNPLWYKQDGTTTSNYSDKDVIRTIQGN